MTEAEFAYEVALLRAGVITKDEVRAQAGLEPFDLTPTANKIYPVLAPLGNTLRRRTGAEVQKQIEAADAATWAAKQAEKEKPDMDAVAEAYRRVRP